MKKVKDIPRLDLSAESYEPVPVGFQTPIKTGFLLGLGIASALFIFKLTGALVVAAAMMAVNYLL